MIHTIKKKLQLLFKRLSYGLFKLLYGEIKDFKPAGNDESSEVLKSNLDNNFIYKVYKVQKARLYTDTINDTAIIQENKIVEGPSFQIRNVKFDKINTNIVFFLKSNHFALSYACVHVCVCTLTLTLSLKR